MATERIITATLGTLFGEYSHVAALNNPINNENTVKQRTFAFGPHWEF